jgi:N-carbamoyl-L-amino-acid hydrolase
MPDMMGSLFHAGSLSLEEAVAARDSDGVSIEDELQRLGYGGADTLDDMAIDTFVELHIEQGPVLETAHKDIGVVTGVQGLSWYEVTVEGASNHAGTTPMNMRRDAGHLAQQLTAQLRALPGRIDGLRLTIGSMRWHPNLVNVIPDRVTFTIDARHPSAEQLAATEMNIEDILQGGSGAGFAVAWQSLARVAPCVFAPRVVDAVSAAVARNGLAGHRMISGAGHDAHILSRCLDAGMVFIPSRNGISHHPDEYSTDAQILSGSQVLLDTILTLADHPFAS